MTEEIEIKSSLLGNSKFDILFMKQVPLNTIREFKELADLEFGGHFGFTLKALMDQTIALQNQMAIDRVEQLEGRIKALESIVVQRQEEKPIRKTIGGKIIGGD